MGGFGSGRPSGTGRETVESCSSIDVNRLHKECCLRPGGWQWTSNGERVAWINLRAEAGCLRMWRRRSESSACPAASADLGLNLFAPA